MRSILLSFLLILSLSGCSSAQDWSPIIAQVKPSLVIVTNEEGFCTGFVISQIKETVMTAAHCIGGTEKVDGVDAEIVFSDQKTDLAVLKVKDLKKLPLRARVAPIEMGMPVASMGYAYRLDQPLVRAGVVSLGPLLMPDISGEMVMTDYTPLKGMSGGPVIDLEGRVVGIIQIGDGSAGLGRSINQIWSQTKTWW